MSPDSNEEAAWWADRVSGPLMSDTEHAQFRAWMQDPENAKAFRQHYLVIVLAGELPSRLHEPAVSGREKQPTRRPILAILIGAAATVALLVFLFGQYLRDGDQTYATRTGEVRPIHLSDGSTATLDTRSRIQVRVTRTERRVNLLDGRALFDIHSDPRHPFIVDVGSARIRVLGTEFDVYRRRNKEITLTVLRGVVEVSGRGNTTNLAWIRHLEANQTLTFDVSGVVSDLHAVASQQRITWPSHVFEAQNVPLSYVIDELSRYTDTNIVLADERLRGINIVATLRVRDIRNALHDLQGIVPIEVEETGKVFIIHYLPERPTRASPQSSDKS